MFLLRGALLDVKRVYLIRLLSIFGLSRVLGLLENGKLMVKNRYYLNRNKIYKNFYRFIEIIILFKFKIDNS
jgi:hypothetical protein